MKRKCVSAIVSMLMIVSAALAGCSYEPPAQSASKPGSDQQAASDRADEIRVGLDVDAGTMDPRLSHDSSSARVIDLVYDGLVRLSDKMEPQPALAEKWENPDPTTWIFTLRKGVTFHDGTPFTAADVKYTYDSLLDPNVKAPYAKLYAPISKVDVVDDYTVKFTLKQPYAPLLSYLDLGIVPKHVAEKPDQSLSSHPVGTGPYKLVKWEKNSKISFEANDQYWGGAPKTKKVTYFIIPDNSTRVSALEAGDVDFVHSPLSPQDIAKIQNNRDFTVIKTEGLGFTYLNFNTTHPILSDVKVRQAIAHLVNKKVISEELYQGMDKPGKSPLIPPSWAYSDKIEGYPYDPEKAKALFAEAGWKDSDGDGILDKGGKKLSLTLSTHTEDPNRIQTVEYLQHEFSKAGIDAKVSTTEWPTFSSNVMSQKFDIALLGWLSLVDPDRAMYGQFHSKSENNYGKYSNPKVDELLEKGRAVLNQEERARIYQEAARIVTDEVAYDVLLYQGYVAMFTNKLTGFKEHPKGSLYSLKDVEVKK
ncbi:ABC transporter substrate-binding protein [Brevibacillus sp. LEMMJ03]|jgi:peptide/nickel transport system substrate-binding protein|uniref:ABC transporter substrate-binding protein n=1 Tax=unclassified Brevibacillus TaxID=2684853 RepID=UPI0007ED694C|nr:MULTISPECIES: ABC transporter substrate-binding protein [unclassified Brevibacillus]TRY26607.1 ABC transporter substrate-binding protein [Brevibacillus sp. LEMMJ03]UYZ15284.1 ABC transporter substrate-binding protein [Brevibacillus sp. WF146]